jgi:hypothetical protein
MSYDRAWVTAPAGPVLYEKDGQIMSRPFTANYPGTCAACLEPIDPGDEVVYEDDELVHEGCATEEHW